MTRLSVNINKIATLRNARGANSPNLIEAAKNCEKFGAQGITVHPRPDERHIRYSDVEELKNVLNTEFNIEGYPSRDFIDLVLDAKPAQVTLVPDPPNVLTSNAGWDSKSNFELLKEVVSEFKSHQIRVSLFMECNSDLIEWAKKTDCDRIELYTEEYARGYSNNRDLAIKPYQQAAEVAQKNQLGLNAGHDLNLDNLAFFCSSIPSLQEVSIGHALISDALYYGLENSIQMYLRQIQKSHS